MLAADDLRPRCGSSCLAAAVSARARSASAFAAISAAMRASLSASFDAFLASAACCLAAGLLLSGTMCLRTIGLQRAASSTVATLLYTEIAWSFVFDIAFNAARPDALQLVGAALIIGGAVVFAFLPQPGKPMPVHAAYEVGITASETEVLGAAS